MEIEIMMIWITSSGGDWPVEETWLIFINKDINEQEQARCNAWTVNCQPHVVDH